MWMSWAGSRCAFIGKVMARRMIPQAGGVRVASPMAGFDRGLVFLPRVGDEVVVEFMEGDPNRPVVVGSLWNGQDVPPTQLPDDKRISLIRSRSTAGGINEIRFDDTAGSESMFISSEHLRLGTPGQSIQLDDDAGSGEMGLTTSKLVIDSPEVLIDGRKYTRFNSVIAWAKVGATGLLSGNSFGIASVVNSREGVYNVTLVDRLESAVYAPSKGWGEWFVTRLTLEHVPVPFPLSGVQFRNWKGSGVIDRPFPTNSSDD